MDLLEVSWEDATHGTIRFTMERDVSQMKVRAMLTCANAMVRRTVSDHLVFTQDANEMWRHVVADMLLEMFGVAHKVENPVDSDSWPGAKAEPAVGLAHTKKSDWKPIKVSTGSFSLKDWMATPSMAFGPNPDRLAAIVRAVWPSAMQTKVECPACERSVLAALFDQVIHLNDYHRWRFAAIAEWLDDIEAKGLVESLAAEEVLIDEHGNKVRVAVPDDEPIDISANVVSTNHEPITLNNSDDFTVTYTLHTNT